MVAIEYVEQNMEHLFYGQRNRFKLFTKGFNSSGTEKNSFSFYLYKSFFSFLFFEWRLINKNLDICLCVVRLRKNLNIVVLFK